MATTPAKDELKNNPLLQFQSWWGEDSTNAFTCLSTVGEFNEQPAPSSRMIELEERPFYSEVNGIVFYTDSTSRKAQEFTANPNVALTILLINSYRQIRIEGTVALLPEKYSSNYFNSLTRERQIVLLIGHQSQPIANRQALIDKKREIEIKYGKDLSLPVPPNWKAYCITPHKIEFYISHDDWLAERTLFTKQDTNEWKSECLMP